MEITTLQQRIEERAEIKLKQHLLSAYQQEREVANMIGHEYFKQQLDVRSYNYGKAKDIELHNEFTKSMYEHMLPNFIRQITDEILNKIDEIDFLVNNEIEEDLPY